MPTRRPETCNSRPPLQGESFCPGAEEPQTRSHPAALCCRRALAGPASSRFLQPEGLVSDRPLRSPSERPSTRPAPSPGTAQDAAVRPLPPSRPAQPTAQPPRRARISGSPEFAGQWRRFRRRAEVRAPQLQVPEGSAAATVALNLRRWGHDWAGAAT